MKNPDIIGGHTIIELDMESPELAGIIMAALLPETRSIPSDRALTKVTSTGSKIIIQIDAGDLTSMRAAINSFLLWV
ncbi:MAG: KEOPS complex subunit Pcc1, partial [Candidatus Thorarchaeota archaeon]